MMSNPDCLLIHTPKFNNYYKPLGHFVWINSMPAGLLGMADFLHGNGLSCTILHLGVQWMDDPSWQLEDGLRRLDPVLIGLSLHWHHQAYDVIEACRRIRAFRPAARIVLGGLTASFFHDELVRDYDCIDAVVRGDGEIPLLRLIHQLKAGDRDLSHIPNLTWRDSQGRVIANKVAYCSTQKVLDDIRFSNMRFLERHTTYVDYITFPFVVQKHMSKAANFKRATIRRKLFPITLGRGCPLNCTWCGGSFVPQKERISGREKIVWRGYDAVIRDIREAMDYGYDAMYSVFDPTPQPGGQDYFIGLFKRIRAEGLDKNLGWMHEATGLASKEFADELAKTFSEDFRIIGISPESGNEQVRAMNKGYFYSNQQLYEMLGHITERNIDVGVFLTYGLPGENEDTFLDTVEMRNQIEERFGRRSSVRALSIEMEPGAPWQLEPERFQLACSRRTFKDFYEAHSRDDTGPFTDLGYYIPDYFRKPLDPADPEADFASRLQRLKCEHLCFLHPNVRKTSSPSSGRAFCEAMRTLRATTEEGGGELVIGECPSGTWT